MESNKLETIRYLAGKTVLSEKGITIIWFSDLLAPNSQGSHVTQKEEL